jgi:sugar phosphate isomerase/epimerase
MKLGLHAYSLVLAAGLREYRPVGRGVMTASEMLDRAKKLNLEAVQLARHQLAVDDMVALANLGKKAKDLGLELHLSTNQLESEHLIGMIHAAHTLGAKQVTVGLCCLQGNVKERQHRLETLLAALDSAIKRAERYKMPLVFENGRHTAAADLAAFIQAAQSDFVGACYDMGNALTVPENPVEAAEILGPYCRCAHMKDFQVFRTVSGVTLVNCPVGEGAVEISDVLRTLKAKKPELTIFLQTVAERIPVPVLSDDFLQRYPRITARALAGLLRRGTLVYDEDALRFPQEKQASEREALKWEDDRLKRSLKTARKLMGTESLTLALG